MVVSVLSGKGGTGKTTIVAALSELARKVIKIDCDVDAPNLFLLYKGHDIEKKDFSGSKIAVIDSQLCVQCDACEKVCKFDAIHHSKIDLFQCEGCGACLLVCPQHAIRLEDQTTAETFLTQTQKGIISRAEMEIGSDGSGKLVTQLRKNAEKIQEKDSLVIMDGSPGLGCAVIASITDTDIALIVTEPTKSGLNDLARIMELTEHFDTQVFVCINKCDINLEMAAEIESYTKEKNIPVIGKIPFDPMVMEAVNSLRPITEMEGSIAKTAIEKMWILLEGIIIKKTLQKEHK